MIGNAGGGTAPEQGARLGGRYRLERLVGIGGMATVWRAQDLREGHPVAVKVLSDSLAHDEAYVRRFAREARLATELSHPNVVEVRDYEADAGLRPYLVMELLEAGTLADRIKAGEPIEVEGLARELLGALEHIHAAGVVHRDVKPANVLFDRSGRPKLTDFGIAQPEDATRYTTTGKVIGTLRYMAPELQRGEAADPRTDLYSLGVLLGDCEPPEALDPLIAALTAERRRDRPSSAAAALALLGSARTAVTTPLPVETRATAPTERLRRRAVRLAPRSAAAALAVVAAIVLGLLLLPGSGSEPEPQRGVGQEPAPLTETPDGGAGDGGASPAPSLAVPLGCEALEGAGGLGEIEGAAPLLRQLRDACD